MRVSARLAETTYVFKAMAAHSDIPGVRPFVWLTCQLCTSSRGRCTILARAVVATRHVTVKVRERGDDEDDAERCQRDVRPQHRAAFVAAERLRVRVDSDGADTAPRRPLLFSLLGRFDRPGVATSRALRKAHSKKKSIHVSTSQYKY